MLEQKCEVSLRLVTLRQRFLVHFPRPTMYGLERWEQQFSIEAAAHGETLAWQRIHRQRYIIEVIPDGMGVLEDMVESHVPDRTS